MSLMYKNKEIGGFPDIDSVVTSDSNNPVSSKAVYKALQENTNIEDIVTTTDLSLTDSKVGGLYINHINGASFQDSTPSANTTIAIQNVADCVEMIQGTISASTGEFVSSTTRICSKDFIACNGGDVIKITVENNTSLLLASFYNESGFLSVENLANVSSAEFITPTNCTKFKILVGNDNGITPETVGKITLTINEKYVLQVKTHGKNCFDCTKLINAIVVDGGYTTTEGWVYADISKMLKPDTTYIFKCNITTENDRSVRLSVGTSMTTYEYGFIHLPSVNTLTFTTPSDISQLVLTFYNGNNTSYSVDSMQIEEGEVATEYEPYTENVATILLDEPLRGNGNITDVICKKDNSYGILRRIKSVILNENTDIRGGGTYCYVFLSDAKPSTFPLSTHYSSTSLEIIEGNTYISPSQNLIMCDSVNGSTISDYKIWLGENNVEANYELLESVFIPLDDESQIALRSLETFNGITYLSVDSRIQPSEIESQYGTTTIGAFTLKSELNNEISNLTSSVNMSDLEEQVDNNKSNVALNKTTIGYTCKNLIPYPYDGGKSLTSLGITYTDNNGIVTVSGTSTGLSTFLLNSRINTEETAKLSLPKGKYILSGNPENVRLVLSKTVNNTSYNVADTGLLGEPIEFEITEDIDNYGLVIAVNSGLTINTEVKPMIRYADIIDDTWEVYTPSVRSEIDNIKNNSGITKTTLGYACKNLLPYPYLDTTQTIQSVEWTDNGDGTITANGTNDSSDTYSIFNCVTRIDTTMPLVLEAGTYILSGCPSGGGNSTYRSQVGKSTDSNFEALGLDYGEGAIFTLEETTQIQVQLMVGKGATVNNVTFKPMIRYADIEDDTYEVYKPSVDTRLDVVESDVSTLKTSVVNKGDLLVPYQEINSSNVITYTDTTYNWSEYKGFVLGLQVIGNDSSVWVETRYIPANFVSLSTTAKHGISIQQIDYRADAYVQINVNTNTLLAFNSNLTSFTKPNIFLYGVK